jgi:hypothetical protein
MKIEIRPASFQCKYSDCPPGLFLYGDMIGLKSEYGSEGYCDSGESFWGGAKTKEDLMNVIVVPLDYEILGDQ